MPSKSDLVLWYVQWDKDGKIVRRLYRPREAAGCTEAPAKPVSGTKTKPIARGVVGAQQGDLPL